MKLVIALFLSLFAFSAAADSEKVQSKLEKFLPIKSVTHVETIDLYQVELTDGTTLFVNKTGDYFVVGDLYGVENQTPVNLTERSKDKERQEAVASIPEEEMVIYPANRKKVGHIYVFTDIDCPYCRRLHNEIDIYTNNGIEVRYIAWPRCGIQCQSYTKATSVWCAEDKLNAMTVAKNGVTLPEVFCDNPVAKQYHLGVKLGLRGTPYIVLSNGTSIGGYLPATEIINRLNSS